MATNRFNYNDKFSLKDQKVGIVSTTPEESLDVASGTLKGVDLQSNSGVTTFSTYEGFQNKKTSYTGSVQIETGESGSLSEIVIGAGATISVGTSAISGQGNIKSLKVSNTFTPPIGGTNERPSAPQSGAIFYNKDFRTIEYWDGNFWRQVDNTTRSGRGVMAGGETSKGEIDYFNIQSKGNTLSFGQLITARGNAGAVSSSTRGIFAGGEPITSGMEYITIASQGNAMDFVGALTANRRFPTGCSSSTRGVFMGGSEPTRVNKIEYIEISSFANAIDFGDLTEAKDSGGGGAWSNGTRGGVMGGYPDTTTIEVLTIATKGNSTKFGETLGAGHNVASTSNHVRAIGAGGSPSSRRKEIQYITMASEGNSVYFGDLNHARTGMNGCSSGTRSVWSGGNDGTTPRLNTMDYVEIATTGNSMDFGDLTYKPQSGSALSDSHGGLGGF